MIVFPPQALSGRLTGNTVLLGLGVAAGNGGTIALTFSAVIAFMAGGFAGAAIAARLRPAARTVLLLEAVILASVAVVWLLYKLFARKPAQFTVNIVIWLAFLVASFAVGRIPGTSILTFALCALVAAVALSLRQLGA